MKTFLAGCCGVLFLGSVGLRAQAPDVPIVEERHGSDPRLIKTANALRDDGRLLALDQVKKQLQRGSCTLKLPEVRTQRMEGRQLWERARQAHVRVGYFYQCRKCTRWHLNLAGGYAISADGAVATCHHVLEPKEDMKEGYLVAATADGVLLPVLEVLAASEFTDAAIVRVEAETPLAPLPLNPNVYPGDDAWCYSDPAGREGYFTHGVVNRFFRHKHRNRDAPLRMNVSTDWAPGSSGAAVMDACGNAMGHVSEIASDGVDSPAGADEAEPSSGETLIVFHSAVRAADVLALVNAP
jgi:hypothetical protein